MNNHANDCEVVTLQLSSYFHLKQKFCGLKANCVIWAEINQPQAFDATCVCFDENYISIVATTYVVVKSPVNNVFRAIRLFDFRVAMFQSTDMKNDR